MVRVAGKHDGKNRFIKLTQEKFSFDQSGRDTRAEGMWVIPITVTFQKSFLNMRLQQRFQRYLTQVTSERDPSSVTFNTILDTKTSTMVIPDTGKNEWIKVSAIR